MADHVKKPPPEDIGDASGAASEPGDMGSQDASGADSPDHANDDEIDLSLHDVLDLLTQQVERLQASLDFHRLRPEPQEDVLRWHVAEIDRRQDRIEEIAQLILTASDTKLH